MTRFLTNLQSKNFELQVWFVTMVIAAMRTLKAVIQDLAGVVNPPVLIVDIFILLTFCMLGVLAYRASISRVPMIAGLILLALLIFSYIQFDGILGTTEYNLMGLGIVFVLVYNKRPLIWLVTLYFASIAMANVDLRLDGSLTQHLSGHYSTPLDNFFTTLLAVLLLIVYFKVALVRESRRIGQLRTELAMQVGTIAKQHKALDERQQQLHEANSRLESEIEKHTRQIILQNKAIADYIRLSTESLNKPLQNITLEVHNVPENGFLESKLKLEVSELQLIVHTLSEDLKRHGDF
jgi:hypothetical protein